jgi:V/A-type H+-transporting ATPase subunit D
VKEFALQMTERTAKFDEAYRSLFIGVNMARLNVNPTRQERTKQKNRLRTANRGKKLLKDKSDEMIRSFLAIVRENRALRERLETELSAALRLFFSARAQMSSTEIEDAVSNIGILPKFVASTVNIMGLIVPKIEFQKMKTTNKNPIFISTPADFDKSIEILTGLTTLIIDLANIEKSCDMLATEIEKVRRRINSLEYIMIPNTIETIKYITMKLDEDQRSQQIRVMKVKAMQTK